MIIIVSTTNTLKNFTTKWKLSSNMFDEVYDQQCLQIIQEIALAGYFVTPEVVCQVLMERYSVTHLGALGIANPNQIPSLQQLTFATNRINTFLHVLLH